MRILLDNNVPRLLTSNLPDHQADTAFQRDWHTLTNGELLDQAESDGYQLQYSSSPATSAKRCPTPLPS